MIAVSELQGRDALASLEAHWSALCDAAGASVFQRPEWLLPYADIFGGAVMTLALRSRERLIGLVPFVERLADGGTERQLLGTGLSDYLDAVIEPACRDAAVDAIASWTRDAIRRGARLDLQQLPADSVLSAFSVDDDVQDDIGPHEPCPVLPLDSGSPEASVPAHMAAKVAYYHRRAQALGSVDFECATPGTCEKMLERLYSLHERRWSGRGGGVLDDPRVRAFHARVVPRLARSDLLAMHALRVNGDVVAVLYGFIDATRGYYYISGFDPDYAAISPGTLCIARAIQHACQRGARAFEFLRGRERYKYYWGALDRPTFRRRIAARHALSRVPSGSPAC